MAETLNPGVFIREAAGATGVVQGVSTSSLAALGRTPIGPVDEPTLVTSLNQFKDTFGLENDPLGLSVIAFFSNGGSRLFVVRTLEADADTAECFLSESVAGEDTGEVGDGTVDKGATGGFPFTTGESPIAPGTLVITVAPGAVAAGSFTTVAAVGMADGQTLTLIDESGLTVIFEFDLTGGNVPAGGNVEIDLFALGAVTDIDVANEIRTAIGLTALTMTADAPGAALVNLTQGAAGLSGNTAIVGTAPFAGLPGAFAGGVDAETATDDGLGGFVGPDSGTVDYVTGEVVVTFGTITAPGVAILAAYDFQTFTFQMNWPGLGGNDYRVDIAGDPAFTDDATASFTKFLVAVVRVVDGEDVTIEAFEGVVLDDSGSVDYIATVLNDTNKGSNLVTVVPEGNDQNPTSLAGTAVVAEAVTESPVYNSIEKAHTYTVAGGSIAETTLTMTLSTGEVVTDDGNGGLVVTGGANTLDPNGTNSVDYDSGVITATWITATVGGTTQALGYFAQAVDEVSDCDMAGGTDGSALSRDALTNPLLEPDLKGIFALDKDDSLMQLAIPAFADDETVMQEAIDFASNRKDRFVLVQVPEGLTPQEAKNWKMRDLNRNGSSYFACYYPRITILNPFTDKAQNVVAVGHVAGIYARVDSEFNVSTAPAGTPEALLAFSIGLERELTRTEVGITNPVGVNALVNWPQTGLTVWGARTGELGGEFRYIQQRRLFMFVEKSVFDATHIHVFQNVGEALFSRIRFQVNGFLSGLFTSGHFAGNTPAEAYIVICDASNNPQASQDAGIVNCTVAIAPTTPGEFLIFTFQRKING